MNEESESTGQTSNPLQTEAGEAALRLVGEHALNFSVISMTGHTSVDLREGRWVAEGPRNEPIGSFATFHEALSACEKYEAEFEEEEEESSDEPRRPVSLPALLSMKDQAAIGEELHRIALDVQVEPNVNVVEAVDKSEAGGTRRLSLVIEFDPEDDDYDSLFDDDDDEEEEAED